MLSPLIEPSTHSLCSQDRVDPGTGFGTHRHQEFEIWSYVVDGELEHRDSMGNLEIMKRGDIQSESAPTARACSHDADNALQQ